MEVSDYWKKWKVKLSEFIKDNNLATYLVFVVVSFIFLYLHALGKEYTTDFDVKIRFKNYPINKERVLKENEDKVRLNVTGYGFSLLRFYLHSIYSEYDIDLSKLEEKESASDELRYDLSEYLVIQQLLKQIGSEQLQINSISPKNILFSVRAISVKKVPISVNLIESLNSGYLLKKGFEIIPDSVIVRGDSNIIDTLQNVKTEPLKLEVASGKFNYDLRLMKDKDLDYLLEDESVKVKGKVVATIAQKHVLDIIPINFPKSISVELYPRKATLSYVSYQEALNKIKDADFRLIVDYNTMSQNKEKLEVQVLHIPENIFNIYIQPRYIDYVIKHK